jgi:group I intron endonuclease
MTDIPKLPGIYRISIGPRTFYWGQSKGLRKRGRVHLNHLKRGDHHNRHLQRSFDKHGEDAFTFEVSLLCPVEDLNMQEQFALDIYHGMPGCANISKVAEATTRGLTISDEHRSKISASMTGRTQSEEHRANLRAPKSAEHVDALREVNRASHPNILIRYICGREEIWPSQGALGKHLGHKNNGNVGGWLSKRRPIPAHHGITSVTRTDLPATIDPENHEKRTH